MTYGGAGTIFPYLILCLLALPTLLIWIYKGSGNSQKRKVIGYSQIAVLVISSIMLFSGLEKISLIGIASSLVVLLIMLTTPILFKKRL